MNTQKLKQYLLNNLWHGENRRQSDVEHPLISSALIQPDYSKTWGVDLSHWDGVVDLAVTKRWGASFVFIKGVDGTIRSKYFSENYTTAMAVGLPCSAYAWLYRNANVSCVAQAQAFDALLNQYPPSANLPPVVDFETTRFGGVVSNPNFDDLRRWVTEFLRLGNPKPLLYSGKPYMDQFGQMPSDLKNMFAGLWIANYSSVNPPLPLGWTQALFHQFSSSGDALLIAPGSTGKKELDLNYSMKAITQPPIGDVEMSKFMKVTDLVTGSLNVRTSGDNLGTQNDLGDFNLVRGDVVHVVEVRLSNNFVRFDALYRNGVRVDLPASPTGQYWSLSKDGSAVWLVDTAFSPPAPAVPSVYVTHTFNDVLIVGGKTYEANFTVTDVEYKPKA